ncbi:hypothetical protein DY000_02045042 [Brassica cretica]|uniref:Transmembrane protein n=1 Tax=Brassica cretica TaxID=69181 RepID=A0ABQ7EUY5_BRACR|nr:hypothetical protein DY000_02045042 [Brassica cretica]
MYQSTNLSFSSSFTHRSLLERRFRPRRPPKPLDFTPSCVSSDPNSSDDSIDLSSKLVSLLKAVPNWSDGIKERRMRQKRSLYTHENWVRHRSSLRHLRQVSSSASSRVILSLIPPVFFFTTVAVLIAGYNSAVGFELLPSFFPVLREGGDVVVSGFSSSVRWFDGFGVRWLRCIPVKHVFVSSFSGGDS